MSSSRPVFRSRWLPYALVLPHLVITVILFIWPAGQAQPMYSSGPGRAAYVSLNLAL